jgi:hypothetical protein
MRVAEILDWKALNPSFTNYPRAGNFFTQTVVTMGIFPFKEKSPWQNRESNPGPHDP